MNLLLPIIAASNSLALALLQASVTTAALVVLLLLARRWGKATLPVRWMYGLALLAMARLALPVLPESAYGPRWQGVPAIPSSSYLTPASPRATSLSPRPLSPDLVSGQASGDGEEKTKASPFTAESPPVSPLPAAAVSVPLDPEPLSHAAEPTPGWSAAPGAAVALPLLLAELVWIGGTLTILLRAGWQTLRFQQRIRRHARPADAGTCQLARETAQRMGLRRPVTVLELPGLSGPVSCGWRAPLIFLPEGFRRSLTAQELRHILAHETAHLRHGDSVLNCLLIPLCALHWFNPMVWLGRRALLADRELLRDQQALGALSHTPGGGGYGRTLLKVTLLNQPSAPAPGLTAFFNTEKEIQRRIAMITHPAPSPRPLLKIAALCTISLLVLGSFTVAPAQKPVDPAVLPPAEKTSRPDLQKPGPQETTDPLSGRPVPAVAPSGTGSLGSPQPTAMIVDPAVLPPGPETPRWAPDQAAPKAEILPEELPDPTPAAFPEERPEDIGELRQEILQLRKELAEIRQMSQAPVKSADLFEQALAEAELKKVKAASAGSAAQHSSMQQTEAEIQNLRAIIQDKHDRERALFEEKSLMEKTVADATQQKVKAERDAHIRRLIAHKSEIARITTELEATPLTEQKPDWRATRFDRLGRLRSYIEEIEIRLKYGLMN